MSGLQSVLHARSWHRDALCGSEGTVDDFFPGSGQSSKAALEICGGCPVRAECLAEAMADPALDFGVRGGLTAAARKARRKANAKRGAS